MRATTPKGQLLKGLSGTQRNVLVLLISKGTLRSDDLPRLTSLRRLQEFGAVVVDPSTGIWYLSHHWNKVLEANAPAPPDIKAKPVPIFKNRAAPEPDAPRTWSRPKAEYANPSWENRIDELLNTPI